MYLFLPHQAGPDKTGSNTSPIKLTTPLGELGKIVYPPRVNQIRRGITYWSRLLSGLFHLRKMFAKSTSPYVNGSSFLRSLCRWWGLDPHIDLSSFQEWQSWILSIHTPLRFPPNNFGDHQWKVIKGKLGDFSTLMKCMEMIVFKGLKEGRGWLVLNFLVNVAVNKALQTAYKVGKDGIEAGTSLVPESIPRPIARISVAVIGSTVVLFLLKSFLSTAFFVLATMGLIYSAFIALNKDEGPTGGSDTTNTTGTTPSTEDSLEEARRIMEKYK
ncbi:hypothetical protein Tco_0034104 [Tanacetum coccineum]